MAKIKVKVTEMTSGNSFIELFRDDAAANGYIEFVDSKGLPIGDSGAILKAEIVK